MSPELPLAGVAARALSSGDLEKELLVSRYEDVTTGNYLITWIVDPAVNNGVQPEVTIIRPTLR